MFSERLTTRLAVAFAGSLAFLAPVPTANGQTTTIDDLVMYGVPQESQELFRYEFGTDTYTTIGVVTDQFGREVVDMKGLTHIPSGSNKGIYGASEEDPFMDYLVKIDATTADATLYSQPMGAGKISGMVSFPYGGKWYLLTADYSDELYAIDPTTGEGTLLGSLSNRYQGLARNGAGEFFGTTGGGEIWAIDLDLSGGFGAANISEWPVGSHGNSGIEALEFALGETEPRVDALGLNGQWVGNGLLLSYGQGEGLLIVNPVTGAAIPYPTAIPSLDLEGVAFLPEALDVWIVLPTALIIYD